MPGTRKKLRYRLIRVVIHPLVWTLILAVVVIGVWVHWRKVVGELKISPWVAVIFLAILFWPAIVELLRRTDKISTSWAEVSLNGLKADVVVAESLEESNNPQPIERKVNLSDSAAAEDDVIGAPVEDPNVSPHPDPDFYQLDALNDAYMASESASDLLKHLPSVELIQSKHFAGTKPVPNLVMLQHLTRVMQETEELLLEHFGPVDGPREFTPEVAEHIVAYTRMTGWTNVAEVWRRAKRQLYAWDDGARSRSKLVLIMALVESAMDILRKQLEAVAEFGRSE